MAIFQCAFGFIIPFVVEEIVWRLGVQVLCTNAVSFMPPNHHCQNCANILTDLIENSICVIVR